MHKGINTTVDEGQTPIIVHGTQDPDISDIVLAFAQNQRDEVRVMDKSGALAARPGAKQQTFVIQERATAENPNSGPDGAGFRPGPAYSLEARPVPQAVANGMAVRRLTPLECERLQGFPDNYTNIPGATDSGRYKALGNSMAVPVMRWIGERIKITFTNGEYDNDRPD